MHSKFRFHCLGTDTDRTIMSAAANLAGMFPPQGDEIWNSDLQWQPIPIHSVPVQNDYILSFCKTCPRLQYEHEKYLFGSDEEALLKKHKPLLQYIELHSGAHLNTCRSVWGLYDILTIEQSRNLK